MSPYTGTKLSFMWHLSKKKCKRVYLHGQLDGVYLINHKKIKKCPGKEYENCLTFELRLYIIICVCLTYNV